MAPPRRPVDLRRVVPSAQLGGPASPPAHATSKIGPVSTDRAGASHGEPLATTSAGDMRSQYFTYLTRVPKSGEQTPILYNGDRRWAKITLELEDAGPVSVGQQANLFPVQGGQGITLETNQPREFVIAKGNRIYIASNTVSRVKVSIEPLPWLEQITGSIRQMVDRLMGR